MPKVAFDMFGDRMPDISEIFRMATERLALGMPKIVPLTMEEMEQPLGPGFTTGWYGFAVLGDR